MSSKEPLTCSICEKSKNELEESVFLKEFRGKRICSTCLTSLKDSRDELLSEGLQKLNG